MKDLTLVELNKKGELFLSDKGSIHSYLKFYDAIFSQFRYKEINIFEVGYQHGGSCELWKQYFLNAHIRSIDIMKWGPINGRDDLRICNKYIEPEGRVRLDMINVNDLTEDYFHDFKPDIAIDDGSHVLEDQIAFIKTVYPVLNNGGYLIVEDIQDLEKALPEFGKFGLHVFVVDRREVSNVYDDVFIYFTKPDKWSHQINNL
jgi:cephalosporin hydroxylase